MQLKKIAIVFLVVVVMLSCVGVLALAQEAPASLDLSVEMSAPNKLSEGDKLIVKPGDIVRATIKVGANPGIGAIQLYFNYDATAVEYVKHYEGKVFSKHGAGADWTVNAVDNPGEIMLLVINDNLVVSDVQDSVLVTFEFTVLDSYDGNIEGFKLSDDVLTFDDNFDSVEYNITKNGETVYAHSFGASEKHLGDCVTSTTEVFECDICGEKVESVLFEANGHTYNFNEEIPASCVTLGTKEHYDCSVCNKIFAVVRDGDNAPTYGAEIDEESLVIPVAGHKCETLNGAVAPTCAAAGQVAHYVCATDGCGKFIAEDKTTVLDSVVLAIDPNAHKCDTLNGAVAPTCVAAGQVAHYVCANDGCGKFIAEDKTTVLDSVVLAIDPNAHKCETLVPAVAPDCVTDGNVAYYVCGNTGCGKYIAEDKATVLESIVDPKVGHKCETLVPAVAPGCEIDGNVAYYVCGYEACGKYIAEDKITVLESIVDPKLGHSYGDLVAKVDPTTEAEGNVAYYQCSVCSKYFDANKKEIASPIIEKLPKMISTPENPVWTKGDDTSLKFVSDADFDKFLGVKLNGSILVEGAYKIESDDNGNTVITIEPSYLETLEKGEYTIAIESENGVCDASFTVENNNAVAVIIIVIAVVVLVAGTAAAVVVLKKKKII